MQENFQKAAGRSLVIVEEGQEIKGNYISLGDTQYSNEDSVVATESLNDDGFLIRKVGKNIYIKGETEYALINGVNYFSEKYLDVEHLTLNYTKYGNISSLYLSDVEDETVAPDFSMRDYYANQSMFNPEYAAKVGYETLFVGGYNNTYNGEGVIIGSIHGLSAILPYSQYPQFYLSDGTQYEIDLTNGLTSNYTYDNSNKTSMASILIEKIKAAILASAGEGRYVMLGLQDSGFIPDANNTTAIKSSLGGYAGLWIQFVNVVSEEIHRWMNAEGISQEVRFVALAYWKTDDYKSCSVKTADYVDLLFADMFCQYHSITSNLLTCYECYMAKKDFDGWRTKIGDNSQMIIYNYATNFTHSLFWFNNFAALQNNIQYYKQCGVDKIIYQGHPHAYNYYQGNLENYILSRLLWDASQNVNDLVYAYNNSYYADSATVINTVYNNMNSYASNSYHIEFYNDESNIAKTYSLANLSNNIALLENERTRVQASDAMSEDEKITRINRILELEVQLRYMVLVNWDIYYTTSNESDKVAYALNLIDALEQLGIEYVGENRSVSALKEQYIAG